jgi:xylulokinase
MSVMGLDIGTTGCKAVAFDEAGAILARAYREYPLLHPLPDRSELDVHMLWQRVSEVLREVNGYVPGDPVVAMAISCQGEAVVPVGHDGQPLDNVVVTFDGRTLEQYRWWQKAVAPQAIFEITGMPLHPMYSLNKIMWFKSQRPALFKQAWKFLCVEDYMIHRLGLAPAIDYSLAARTMAFDVRRKQWSGQMLSWAGVDEDLLAGAVPSGACVGDVDPKVAAELGFRQKVMVVAGGHDQPCGALGAGIISPGIAMNAIGTSDVVCPAFAQPILSEQMRKANYSCYPHTYPDTYVTIAFNLTGGLLLRWYRDTLCQTEIATAQQRGQDPYDIIIDQASADPADVLILPHFVGSGTPTMDPLSRGAILGLSLSTTKAELTRAVLDCTSYEMCLNLETMASLGILIDELRAVGGGSKSARWLQLKADVFGKPVVSLQVSEAACLGAAILAGTAAGVFSSIDAAVKASVRVAERFTPNPFQHALYEERFKRFCSIYPLLQEFNHGLAQTYAPLP